MPGCFGSLSCCPRLMRDRNLIRLPSNEIPLRRTRRHAALTGDSRGCDTRRSDTKSGDILTPPPQAIIMGPILSRNEPTTATDPFADAIQAVAPADMPTTVQEPLGVGQATDVTTNLAVAASVQQLATAATALSLTETDTNENGPPLTGSVPITELLGRVDLTAGSDNSLQGVPHSIELSTSKPRIWLRSWQQFDGQERKYAGQGLSYALALTAGTGHFVEIHAWGPNCAHEMTRPGRINSNITSDDGHHHDKSFAGIEYVTRETGQPHEKIRRVTWVDDQANEPYTSPSFLHAYYPYSATRNNYSLPSILRTGSQNLNNYQEAWAQLEVAPNICWVIVCNNPHNLISPRPIGMLIRVGSHIQGVKLYGRRNNAILQHLDARTGRWEVDFKVGNWDFLPFVGNPRRNPIEHTEFEVTFEWDMIHYAVWT